jgi:hypothetical protein
LGLAFETLKALIARLAQFCPQLPFVKLPPCFPMTLPTGLFPFWFEPPLLYNLGAGVQMRITVWMVLVFASTSAIFGSSRFRGNVTDASGAAISGAMILIHWDPAGSAVGLDSNIGIKKDLVLTTDATGSFATALPRGFYDLLVSAMAFNVSDHLKT